MRSVLHRNETKGDESRCHRDYPNHHLSALLNLRRRNEPHSLLRRARPELEGRGRLIELIALSCLQRDRVGKDPANRENDFDLNPH